MDGLYKSNSWNSHIEIPQRINVTILLVKLESGNNYSPINFKETSDELFSKLYKKSQKDRRSMHVIISSYQLKDPLHLD